MVDNPPKTVWTRELKFGMFLFSYKLHKQSLTYPATAGVGHASAMFKRGIRICTGSGR